MAQATISIAATTAESVEKVARPRALHAKPQLGKAEAMLLGGTLAVAEGVVFGHAMEQAKIGKSWWSDAWVWVREEHALHA